MTNTTNNNTTNSAADSVAADSDDALMAREVYESQDDSLLLCASDLQHSAIYDNHIEMQSCIRAVADRITALASVIEGVERAALAAPAQAVTWPRNAAEVREFMEDSCQREEYENDDNSPSVDDLYVLTAYNFLSAVNSWAAEQPAQAGEYPKFPKPPMFDAVYCQGNPVSHGYSASQVRAIIDADRAARAVYSRSMDLVRVFWQQHTQAYALSMTMAELHDDVELVIRTARRQTLRLLTQEEMDSLGRRAEGMDGNEWDKWVQEKFAQVNGLKVQGGSYEWAWE